MVINRWRRIFEKGKIRMKYIDETFGCYTDQLLKSENKCNKRDFIFFNVPWIFPTVFYTIN